MALGNTDGAPASIDQDNPWDGVFAEGRAVGESFIPDSSADLDTGTPQGTDAGLSDGAGSSGSPSAPRPASTGDDGAPDPLAPPASSGTAETPSPADTDPLAGAVPFTFDVDGTPETIEGAYRLPGDGLYVPEEKVPQFQLLASQARTLDRQNRDLYERSQSLERLTAWQTRDANGATTTLTGQAGLEAQRLVLAEFAAKTNAYEQLLADPAKLAGLITVTQDEQGQVTGFQIDPAALENFQTRVQLDTMRATQSARTHLTRLAAPPPPPVPDVSEHAAPTITKLVADYKITGLQPADHAFLATEFRRYVIAGPKGERQVDPRFLDVVKDRAELRQAQVRAAATSAQSDKFNGGMNRGRQAAAPARPSSPPAPLPTGRNAPKVRSDPSPNDMWATLIDDARNVTI